MPVILEHSHLLIYYYIVIGKYSRSPIKVYEDGADFGPSLAKSHVTGLFSPRCVYSSESGVEGA